MRHPLGSVRTVPAMSRFRYSVHMITYETAGYKTLRPKDAEAIFSKLKAYGYDGIEPMGVPERMRELKPIIELKSSYQLDVPMIAGIWGRYGAVVGTFPNKDPTSSDPKRREEAVEYIKRCSDIAVMFDAPLVQTTLGPLEDPDLSKKGTEKALRNLKDVFKRSAPYAGDRGVGLVIEPQSRYEGYYGVNTTAEMCLDIIEDVGYDNVSLMVDSFHANIEEESLPTAIRRCKKRIRHVHFADNNRLPPGMGAIDFKPLLRSLIEISYRGFIGLECMPIKPEPNVALEKGINYLRGVEDAMRQ
jgi:sugar phosphate isomerase/epimerase